MRALVRAYVRRQLPLLLIGLALAAVVLVSFALMPLVWACTLWSLLLTGALVLATLHDIEGGAE